jgi:GNAT superfamily N-acetyltransferase
VSKALQCIAEIRSRGDGEGYVTGSTLFGPGFVGLKATRAGRVVITDLWISPSRRGEGLGQRVLDTCTEVADAFGVELQLRPREFDRRSGGMSSRQLRWWYARNGFRAVSGSEFMRRALAPSTAKGAPAR